MANGSSQSLRKIVYGTEWNLKQTTTNLIRTNLNRNLLSDEPYLRFPARNLSSMLFP